MGQADSHREADYMGQADSHREADYMGQADSHKETRSVDGTGRQP